MASPNRCETSAKPITSSSVWHWFHRSYCRDTASCIGRVCDLSTSLAPPIFSVRKDLVADNLLTHVRRVSKHPRRYDLLRRTTFLKNQGSPSGCGPIGGRAS